MKVHMLLTDNLKPIPKDINIIMDFGELQVVFPDKEEPHDYLKSNTETGLHCVVEGNKEDIVKWLKPFDGFIKGNGTPRWNLSP